MLNFQPRASAKIVQQISDIERFAGKWDQLSLSPVHASEETHSRAIIDGATASLLLDASTAPELITALQSLTEKSPLRHATALDSNSYLTALCEQSGIPANFQAHLLSYLHAHTYEVPLTAEALCNVHASITGDIVGDEYPNFFGAQSPEKPKKAFRNGGNSLVAPLSALLVDETPDDQIIFSGISSFLIDKRLRELIVWVESELIVRHVHPLFTIAAFHLLLLQIQPFSEANHRLALLLTWHMLIRHGYHFIRYSHFSPYCLDNPRGYFAALRQAEKTAGGDWATFNSWFEFFLDALLDAAKRLQLRTQKHTAALRLTPVQSKIVEIVKKNGAATREVIATKSGINVSTVKYNLSVLVQRGLLKRRGGGRTTCYTPI